MVWCVFLADLIASISLLRNEAPMTKQALHHTLSSPLSLALLQWDCLKQQTDILWLNSSCHLS